MKKIIILILTGILMSCSVNKEIATTNPDFFVFEPDVRLFTSYAFMNAAGFDFDYAEKHPIRVEVRNYLDSVLTKEYKAKINRFYKEHDEGDFFAYGVYAMNCSSPPVFTLQPDSSQYEFIKGLEGYDDLLAEFYETARIETLWNKYKNRLYEINMRYEPYARIALRQITDFCRVDSNYYRNNIAGHFYYQQMPLMSHYTAFFNEIGEDCWVVNGAVPEDNEPGPGTFYHESLHQIINPVVEKNRNINERIKALIPLSQERLQGSYHDLEALICESLVRAINQILAAEYYELPEKRLQERVEDEYRLGHILSLYLLEALPAYRQSGQTFEEYYPVLISNMDVDKEINRWNIYWKDK